MAETDPTLDPDVVTEQLIADHNAELTARRKPGRPPGKKAASEGVPMDQVLELIREMKGAGTPDLEAILTRVLGATASTSATVMQTVLNRSNANYISRSPYVRADGSECIPRYDVFFGGTADKGKGGRLPKDQFTELECDLINRFAVGDHKTARDGKWSAEALRNGTTHELIVKVPMYSQDQRSELPSFALILTELLDGQAAVTTETLVARVAELERKLASTAAA